MELNNITNTGTWGQQVTRLNDNFNKVALGIDTLQEMYESLSQSAIEVVDTLPQIGEANKIYRLVGTTSYSDYMYNADDLNTPILMATYNNAIDDAPTAGSDNLVKSGGVHSSLLDTQRELQEELNQAVESITPIEITGDVTNAPDEEDLTSVNVGGTDVLKFKDKAYTPLTYSGLGRKILRKNIVDGVNALTQEMMSDANTIYVIQYDFTLGEDIIIPDNCVLEFDGGSISASGSNDTVTGNNTVISAELVKIFSTDIQFDGTFMNKTLYVEWFGAVPDNKLKAVQNVAAINAACAAAISHSGDNIDDALKTVNSVTLQPKLYYVDGTLKVPSAYFHFGADEEKPIGYVNLRMATIQQVSSSIIPVIELSNRKITTDYFKEGIDHLIIENINVYGNGKNVSTFGIGKKVSNVQDATNYLMWISDTKFKNVAVYNCRYGIHFSLPKTSYIRTFYAEKVSCRENVIGFYIQTYIDDGTRNNCWMNVNKFTDCLFTNNTIYGILIGKMFHQMYNTVFDGCIIQDNGYGYSYTDYEEFGAGGIRLIHGSADFYNCYFEGNYARRNSSGSYDSNYEEIINGQIEPKASYFSGNEGNIVVNGGKYINLDTCVCIRSHRLICVYCGSENISIVRGLYSNGTGINQKTSNAIVTYLLNSYPNESIYSNIDIINISCKNIGKLTSDIIDCVYKIQGQIGSHSAITRKLIKEAYIDIDVSGNESIKLKKEQAYCGTFDDGVTFYIDTTNGNDKNTGTNPNCALKSFAPISSSDIELPYNINIVFMPGNNVWNFSSLFGAGKGVHSYTFMAYDPINYPLKIAVADGSTTLQLLTNTTSAGVFEIDKLNILSANSMYKYVISDAVSVPSGAKLKLLGLSAGIVPIIEFVGNGKITGEGTFEVKSNRIECDDNNLSRVLACTTISGTYATGQTRFNPTAIRMEMFNGTTWVNFDGSPLT